MRYRKIIFSKKKVFVQPSYEEMIEYLNNHTEMRVKLFFQKDYEFIKKIGYTMVHCRFGISSHFKPFWYSIIKN